MGRPAIREIPVNDIRRMLENVGHAHGKRSAIYGLLEELIACIVEHERQLRMKGRPPKKTVEEVENGTT